jgi:DNA-binding NarL/FixJ family response regulator
VSAGGRIRVVLADDHALVLEGLRSLLEAESDMDVVATAASGEQLLVAARLHRPDVVVLDLEIGGISGVQCLERIRAEGLPVKVLVLTAYSDGESLRAALAGGADGYALKTEPPMQTVDAIRQVHRGRLVFPQAAKRWLHGGGAPHDATQLTEREEAVLALVAEGATNAQIAARLRVSENTVKFHLQNLFLKLGVANRTEAAAQYLRDRPIRR